jgi:hypothetical protein
MPYPKLTAALISLLLALDVGIASGQKTPLADG